MNSATINLPTVVPLLGAAVGQFRLRRGSKLIADRRQRSQGLFGAVVAQPETLEPEQMALR
jgi:hypothetical protein